MIRMRLHAKNARIQTGLLGKALHAEHVIARSYSTRGTIKYYICGIDAIVLEKRQSVWGAVSP